MAQVLEKQLLRSGTAVETNYQEADNAPSRAEFPANIGDSLKELSESARWMELLDAETMVPERKIKPPLEKPGERKAIFITIIKKTRNC